MCITILTTRFSQLSQSPTVQLYSGVYYFMVLLMNYFNSFDTKKITKILLIDTDYGTLIVRHS